VNIDEVIEMYLSKGWKADIIHKHLVASGHTVYRSYVRKLAKRYKSMEKKEKIIVQISEIIHAESHPKDIRNALIEVRLRDYGI
jgi:hypothetical protein